jgi:hypothetical protein
MERRDRNGAGIPRDQVSGRLQDPTGIDPDSTRPAPGSDQKAPKGAEGREGGTAGKRDDAGKAPAAQ